MAWVAGRLLAIFVAFAVCAGASVELPGKAPLPGARPVPPAAAPDAAPSRASAGMPAEEAACRARLVALGVSFSEHGRLSEPAAGCLVEYPVAVRALGPDIPLEPEAVMNCATAEAAARFARDTISPEAERIFGSPLAGVSQASAYVCRTRHGQSKISEHALGNALDLAAFRLKDGTGIEVKAYGPAEPLRSRFLRSLRARACGPFKTVLGPGSDADHALHLHLDLQQRRNGGTYCQ